MTCYCFLRPIAMREHLTSSSYITRNVVLRALLVILKSRVRLVPSFVELHFGTVFGYYRLFYWLLQGCAGSGIQIRLVRFQWEIASNGKLELSRGNRDLNGNCSFWHAWRDCYCILKSNTGTVYSPIDIPFNPPTSPPPKKKERKEM